jgi:hypothetical protein
MTLAPDLSRGAAIQITKRNSLVDIIGQMSAFELDHGVVRTRCSAKASAGAFPVTTVTLLWYDNDNVLFGSFNRLGRTAEALVTSPHSPKPRRTLSGELILFGERRLAGNRNPKPKSSRARQARSRPPDSPSNSAIPAWIRAGLHP